MKTHERKSKMQSPQETKLVNPPKEQVKMVKCKAISGIWLDRTKNLIPPGQFVDLTEAEAKEFCDQAFVGPYNFTGEHSKKSSTRNLIRRAVRVEDLEAIEKAEKIRKKASAIIE